MWTLIDDARKADSLTEQVRLLQEITAYVMQTGPKGGRYYMTPKGKKVYRELGGKSGKSVKLRQLQGKAYEEAWKSLGPASVPVTRPSGEDVGRALKRIFGNNAPDPKALGEMFSDLGLDAQVRHISVNSSDIVSVSYDVKDANGASVGDMARDFYTNDDGEPEVYHDFLTLSEQYQGGGRGGTMLGKALKAYKQMGVKKVKVTAALEAGPYAWARFGFDMGTPDQLAFRKKRFGVFLQKLGVKKRAADKILARVKDMHGLAGIRIQQKNAEGKLETIKAGKDFLLHGSSDGKGTSWQGTFDLEAPKAVARWKRQSAKGRKKRKAAVEAGVAAVPMSQEKVDEKKGEYNARVEKYKEIYARPVPSDRPQTTQSGGALDLLRRLGSRRG